MLRVAELYVSLTVTETGEGVCFVKVWLTMPDEGRGTQDRKVSVAQVPMSASHGSHADLSHPSTQGRRECSAAYLLLLNGLEESACIGITETFVARALN